MGWRTPPLLKGPDGYGRKGKFTPRRHRHTSNVFLSDISGKKLVLVLYKKLLKASRNCFHFLPPSFIFVFPSPFVLVPLRSVYNNNNNNGMAHTCSRAGRVSDENNIYIYVCVCVELQRRDEARGLRYGFMKFNLR